MFQKRFRYLPYSPLQMNFRPLYAIVAFLIFASTQAWAQDPHFSQFYAAPQHINPALTGVFNGGFRMTLNHRQQWASVISKPFITSHAGVEYRRRVFRGDYWAVGMNIYNDQVGVGRLQRNQVQLGFSYLKQLGGGKFSNSNSFLVAGFQAGAGQQSLDYSRLWFSRQFDPDGQYVNGQLPSGENPLDRTEIYPDVQAGLLFYTLVDENNSYYFGGSMHHINQPRASFFGIDNETIMSKYSGIAGGQVELNREYSLLPSVLFMLQGPSMETNLGTHLRYTNRSWKDIAIRFGTFTRLANRAEKGILTDAIILSGMAEMQNWNVGFSYDLNMSSLSLASNRRGAFEVSLIYTHKEKSRYRTLCPRF
jgi:type IX secretion system PorP/SprF family membrane protein